MACLAREYSSNLLASLLKELECQRTRYSNPFALLKLNCWIVSCLVAEECLRMAVASLKKMAAGGMWDHVGGGFHRYSVDERWHVPHFEKMLYDNPQLAQT